MAYYPKSQIKTNLYTNGNEYQLSTTQIEYIGYYYELSNGDIFTGKTPEDEENILLKDINITPMYVCANKLKNLKDSPRNFLKNLFLKCTHWNKWHGEKLLVRPVQKFINLLNGNAA